MPVLLCHQVKILINRYYDGLPVPAVKSVDFFNDAMLRILLRGYWVNIIIV